MRCIERCCEDLVPPFVPWQVFVHFAADFMFKTEVNEGERLQMIKKELKLNLIPYAVIEVIRS